MNIRKGSMKIPYYSVSSTYCRGITLLREALLTFAGGLKLMFPLVSLSVRKIIDFCELNVNPRHMLQATLWNRDFEVSRKTSHKVKLNEAGYCETFLRGVADLEIPVGVHTLQIIQIFISPDNFLKY